MLSLSRTVSRCLLPGIASRSSAYDSLRRYFSETACIKTEKEMMGAFQEMQQAQNLMNKGVYKEAEQLYSRVNDIVASFSPKNGPMVDVINRKKVELLYRSKRPEDLKKLMKEMKDNIDSRGDKDEAIIERLEFANVLLHMGNTADAATYVKELDSLCKGRSDALGLSASLLSSLQKHLTGEEKIYEEIENNRDAAKKLSKEWELVVLNNAIGMRWDDDADTDSTLALCKEVQTLSESIEKDNLLTDSNEAFVRSCLNNAGAYDLFKEKIDDGGALLKYALKLSDNRGISINENITSSNTLGSIAHILLKQDQAVTCEGLYLQALEVFTKKEKEISLKRFSCEEIFDYSKVCDGYAQLLLKWEKREPLGEKYQQKAVDLLMALNENADWMFPLTSRLWTPSLFNWGRIY